MTAVTSLALVLLTGGPAAAHTDFSSSDPADGAEVVDPVESVTVTFTGPVELTGDGFVALRADGSTVAPTVDSADGASWTLHFDPPLVGGQSAVRWTVMAPDSHVLDGAVAFTVAAPATTAVPAAASPGRTADDSPADDASGSGLPVDGLAGGDTTTTAAPRAAPVTAPTLDPVSTEEFLDGGGPSIEARAVAATGRGLGFAGILAGVGGAAFLLMVARGTGDEIAWLTRRIRVAGVLALLGPVVQLAGQSLVESGAVSVEAVRAVLSSMLGLTIALRAAGAVLVVVAVGARSEPAPDTRPAVEPAMAGASVNQWPGAAPPWPGPPRSTPDRQRWRPAPAATFLLVAGVVLLLGSHLFAGHTVTEGDRFVTGAADVVHVAAASVWAGGVVWLAVLLAHRHRAGRPLRAADLGARFSVLATGALVVVGLAGVALTVIVLDGAAELWTTAWGQLLLAKVGLVAVAAAFGGYNHLVVVPMLADGDNGTTPATLFRRVVAVEAVVLVLVVAVTAVLVAAAS